MSAAVGMERVRARTADLLVGLLPGIQLVVSDIVNLLIQENPTTL